MSRADTVASLISRWREKGDAFVCFREPGASHCRCIRGGRLEALDGMDRLDGREGFVFAPFRAGEGHPVWMLRAEEEAGFPADRIEGGTEKEAPAPVPVAGRLDVVPSPRYARAFAAFSCALCAGEFQKLVLSRRVGEPCPAGFSWAEAFRAACRRYVHSYVYLFYAPQTGYWLGATPEILLRGRGGAYETVALAGTQCLKDGRLAGKWSAKNIREQAFVADYVADGLRGLGLACSAEGPFTVTAGELAHLKTVFRFSLPAEVPVGRVLQVLHPTPAVCGLPKEAARRFIDAQEGYDRGYYAGFLGTFDLEGETALYVNLRCMQSAGNGADLRLYAGGGLLPSSVLEEEWMETERKLQTMKYVISKGIPSEIYR